MPVRNDYKGFTYPEHHQHKQLEKRRFELAPGVYAFVGYGVSTFSIIIGTDGYILVDTGSGPFGAAEALKEIEYLTPLPLSAIILTHSHPDHRGGGQIFTAGRQVPVWGRRNFGVEQSGFKGLENIAAKRGARQFGVEIPATDYTPNALLPRGEQDDVPGTLLGPNTFIEEPGMKLVLAGVPLELYALSGETTDHLIVWLPEKKVLFSGDTLYRSFPNIYPVRGTAYRDMEVWASAPHRLMEFQPDVLVMGHTEPAFGDEAMEMLQAYGDALQYVFMETIKGMDAGLTPDELAVTVTLPDHLRTLPYLAEYYGAVPWAVRAVYSGLLGWFDGNPTNLMPLAPTEEAIRMADMAGGVEGLLERAKLAFENKDYPWAARLADYIFLLDDEHATLQAKTIKAGALEALSSIVLPITGKNYLLSCAMELRKK